MSFIQNEKCTFLITGGASGLGLALGKKYIELGHEVIAVANDQELLDQAKSALPQLITIFGDVSTDKSRRELVLNITQNFPQVNVLINNAALNMNVPLLLNSSEKDWTSHKEEIHTNLVGTMHLSILFINHLSQKPNAMIANVSCISAFVPFVKFPSYSASQAGIHSFTMSLRHQLKDSPIQVVEFIPPLLDTPLLPEEFRTKGVKVEEFVEAATPQILSGKPEVSYKCDNIIMGSRSDLDAAFRDFNASEVMTK